MKRIWGCAVLLGLLWAAPVWADDNGLFSSAEVPRVLTPARLDQPISEVPASVTVIDRQLIRASGARELYEVLRLVPGMSVAKTSGNVPSVAYHGTQATDQRRMLVLIDGRSVYQSGLARVDWNNLPISLDDVERIEITRGPAAAAYGANAFSGVINIITRDPRDSSGQSATTRIGNDGIRDLEVTASHHFSNGAARVSVASQGDHGYDAGLIRGGDSKRTDRLNGRVVWELNDSDTLTLFAGGSHARLDRPPAGDLGGIAEFTGSSEQRNDQGFLQAQWLRQFSPDHQLKITAYTQYYRQSTNLDLCFLDPFTGQRGPGGAIYFSREMRELFLADGGDINRTLADAPSDPAIQQRYATLMASGAGDFCGQGNEDIHTERYDLELQDTRQLAAWARLVSGVDLRRDRAVSQAFLSGADNNDSARVFGDLALRPLKNVTVNLGGFWEREQISGEDFSPRAGINWQFLPGQSLRFVYSRGVRTPDIYEERADINLALQHQAGGFAGNDQALLGWDPAYFFVTQRSPGTLQPEYIRSREVGYYGHFASGLEMDLSYFREDLWNLVSQPLNPLQFEANNDGRVSNEGAELQAGWRVNRHHFLRLTAAHINSHSNFRTETRFSARNSGSALWLWTLNNHWFWSTVYYWARDYNGYPFERLDNQLGYRHRFGGYRWEWRLMVQHPLNDQPIVFQQNRYRDDNRYWLTMTVHF